MGKQTAPKKKAPKFKDGAQVKYYGNTYTIDYCFTGDHGHWYKLVDRLGLIHEQELKAK